MKRKADSILIPLDEARDLVAPAKLEDVLTTLLKEGLICRWATGTRFLALRPSAGKRFDVAALFAETVADVPRGHTGPLPSGQRNFDDNTFVDGERFSRGRRK